MGVNTVVESTNAGNHRFHFDNDFKKIAVEDYFYPITSIVN